MISASSTKLLGLDGPHRLDQLREIARQHAARISTAARSWRRRETPGSGSRPTWARIASNRPSGISATDNASMGANGGCNARRAGFFATPPRRAPGSLRWRCCARSCRPPACRGRAPPPDVGSARTSPSAASAARSDRPPPRSAPGPASPAPRADVAAQVAGSVDGKAAHARRPRATAAKSIGCSSQPYSGLPRNTICSHLIWPSVLFLMTTIFTSSLYFARRSRARPSACVSPPSPTKATTCRSGIGERGGDRVGQAARHGGEVAGAREHHVAAHVEMARRPGRDRAGVGGDDGIVGAAAC